MANPFYTPSGNPGTGSEGLSALMRGEFIAISAAFDTMPRITTIGLFDTIISQQGSYTFTLPNGPGTFAMLTDVSAETTRATTAEGVLTGASAANAAAVATNAAAIATKQASLGFTPVQQGTGVGQLSNTVKIGWTTGGLAASVDTTSLGLFVTVNQPAGFALTTAVAAETTRAEAAEGTLTTAIAAETTRAEAAEGTLTTAVATKQASLGFTPVQQGTGIGQLANVVKLGWTGSGLSVTVDATNEGQIPSQNTPGNFTRNGDSPTFGNVTATGAIYASSTITNNSFYLSADSTLRRLNWSEDGTKLAFNPSSGVLVQYNSVGSSMLQLDSSGNFTVLGTVTASNVSDGRTKRDQAPYRRGLAAVIGLETISYQYNGLGGTTDTGKTRWGVVAQQARDFLPECVYETPEPDADPTRPDHTLAKLRLPGQLSLDEQPLIYAMVNAFRDVVAELTALKARIAVLEARP
jgi:hypothetical protein